MQTFQWNIRSSTFTKDSLVFAVAPPAFNSNASALLTSVLDPTFAFSDYKQQTYTIPSGIYANYHVLSISFHARRISTMSSIFLIFPLCLVCLALMLVLSQEPAKDNRLAVPASGITATMYFSFVVSNMCPPVSYLTRMHLLIFQTYIFATAELCFNYYLWRIQAARKELADNNASNKNVLNDAHWMPRKILPPPTNAVVQPDGVYKSVEQRAEPSVVEKALVVEESKKAVELPAIVSAASPSISRLTPAPPPFRILFPPSYLEGQSHAVWDMPPSTSPSPGPASIRGTQQYRSVSADMVVVGESPAATAQGFQHPTDRVRFASSPQPSAQETGLQSVRQVGPMSSGAMMDMDTTEIQAVSANQDPPSRRSLTPVPEISNQSARRTPSFAVSATLVMQETSASPGAQSNTVAGARFGSAGMGGSGSAGAAAPEAKKQKSADTGAYVDKSGEFKDVMDLLDSAEVKTFKKLRWGSPDVFLFRGLLKVSGTQP